MMGKDNLISELINNFVFRETQGWLNMQIKLSDLDSKQGHINNAP